MSEWASRRGKAEKADAGAVGRAPSVRTIARLLTVGRDRLSKSETITVSAIERVEARDAIAAFHEIVRRKAHERLDGWLDRARHTLIGAFANGLMKDKAAVVAAISSQWSNGQTEGQICKLKLMKRQMYGRGKTDLLQARVMGLA